ncbi:MAG: hypothetical protein ABIH23_33440 [bacterium]
MLNEPPPQNKARVEIVPVAGIETDGRFVRLDFISPTLSQRALAAQFFEVACRKFRNNTNRSADSLSPLLNRPFSVHRWIDGGFSTLFDVIGPGTRQLSALQSGDNVLVIGPLGQGMEKIPGNVSRLVLVAGGIGVAAFTIFAQLAQRQRVPCRLYYGVNRKGDLALTGNESAPHGCSLLAEFEALGCRWSLASMLDNSFYPGTVVDLLDRDWKEKREPFDTPRENILLVGCGPWPMMRALAAWSQERKLRCFLLLEEMMGCGLGICRSCVVPGFDFTDEGRRIPRNLAVCRDGPMISADRIDWERGWS